jgi:hypothetical protein
MLLSVYGAQNGLLRSIADEYEEGVQAFTVMGCQGKEADVVLLSLTRSNTEERPRAALGSITRQHDLNVALSRAKSLLIIIGDATHVRAFGHEAGKLGELLTLVENWPDTEHSDEVGMQPALELILGEATVPLPTASSVREVTGKYDAVAEDLTELPPDTIDDLYGAGDPPVEVISE